MQAKAVLQVLQDYGKGKRLRMGTIKAGNERVGVIEKIGSYTIHKSSSCMCRMRGCINEY